MKKYSTVISFDKDKDLNLYENFMRATQFAYEYKCESHHFIDKGSTVEFTIESYDIIRLYSALSAFEPGRYELVSRRSSDRVFAAWLAFLVVITCSIPANLLMIFALGSSSYANQKNMFLMSLLITLAFTLAALSVCQIVYTHAITETHILDKTKGVCIDVESS